MSKVKVKQLDIAGTPDGTKFLKDDGTWGSPTREGTGHVIQEEGVSLTARATLDFKGTGVTVTDDAGNTKTVVTVPGTAQLRGAWDTGTSYAIGDVVDFDGDLWRALTANSGAQPSAVPVLGSIPMPAANDGIWNLNGSAAYNGAALRLTNGGSQAGNAVYESLVTLDGLDVSVTMDHTNGGADAMGIGLFEPGATTSDTLGGGAGGAATNIEGLQVLLNFYSTNFVRLNRIDGGVTTQLANTNMTVPAASTVYRLQVAKTGPGAFTATVSVAGVVIHSAIAFTFPSDQARLAFGGGTGGISATINVTALTATHQVPSGTWTRIYDGNAATGGGGGGGHVVYDETIELPQRSKLKFAGPGVVATDDQPNDQTVVTIPELGHVIQDETTVLSQRSKLAFVGALVTATDDSAGDRTVITITTPPDLIGDTHRGVWSNSYAYAVGDVVEYGGDLWRATASNTGVTPAVAATPFVADTDSGTWVLNGGATLVNGDIRLLNGEGGAARTAIYNQLVDIANLDITFVWSNTGGADGTSFGLLDPANSTANSIGGGNVGLAGLQGFRITWNYWNSNVRMYYNDVQLGADIPGGTGSATARFVFTPTANPNEYTVDYYRNGVLQASRTFTADHTQARVAFGAGSGGYSSTVWVTSVTTPAISWSRAFDGKAGHDILDETTPMPARGKLAFVGAGVAVTDDSAGDKTIVTVTQVPGDQGPQGEPGVDGTDGQDLAIVDVVNAIGLAGTTETLPDIPVATLHYLTLDANLVLAFPAAAAGKSFTLAMLQDPTGGWAVTFPANVKWPGGIVPALTTAGGATDVLSFVCVDGTNWLGFVAGQGFI